MQIHNTQIQRSPKRSAVRAPATTAMPQAVPDAIAMTQAEKTAARTTRKNRRTGKAIKRLVLKRIAALEKRPEAQALKKKRRRPTPGSRYPQAWQAWIADEILHELGLRARAKLAPRAERKSKSSPGT